MKSSYILQAGMALLLAGSLQAQRPQPTGPRDARTPIQVADHSAQLIGPYEPSQKLRLVFGLRPPKAAEEQKFLRDLYTPSSPVYRQFLTAEQWNDRFSPSAADEQAVVDWIMAQGLTVTKRYPNRLIVDAEGTVGQIQTALAVNINRYQLNGANSFSNDRDPVIPAQLSNIVLSVLGLNSMQVMHSHSRASTPVSYPDYSEGPVAAPAGEGRGDGDRQKLEQAKAARKAKPRLTNGFYDPTDIYSSNAYDYDALNNLGHCCNPMHVAGGTPPSTSIAIATVGTQQLSDMQGFHNQFPYLAYNITYFNIDGTPPCCDIEGTLDAEWATATANSFGSSDDTAHVYVYQGANNLLSTFTDIYNQMVTDGHAKVMSVSWGCAEFGPCATDSLMDTQDAIFSSMTGQGWTLIADADDKGSVADCATVSVEFPASSPNVIAAGGTELDLNLESTFAGEVAWTGLTFSGACLDNFGGGGGGFSQKFDALPYQEFIGEGVRTLPDISLNAAIEQTIFFGGAITQAGGTSIVAPELAGFFAQENAYLGFLGYNTVGNANYSIYAEAQNAPFYAPHNPFYDITFGCNSNDVTINNHLTTYYCAVPGYDFATGLGSVNMLQLAWEINYGIAGDLGPPEVRFNGALPNTWYRMDQQVVVNASDSTLSSRPPIGVAGLSIAWDGDPDPESFSENTPGSGDAFYDGPQLPNQTTGTLVLSSAGQGCHTANARAWDNAGTSSGLLTYGPICYDTIAPVTIAALSGKTSGGVFTSGATVTLTATDSGSGVAGSFYSFDGVNFATYTAPFAVTSPGSYTLHYYSTDIAGNTETAHIATFTVGSNAATTVTTVSSSMNPSTFGSGVTFTARVSASTGPTPTGSVTFKDGSTTLGSGTLSGGLTTLATKALAGGKHAITAVYAGNSSDAGSTSTVLTQAVTKAATTTTVSSSQNPSTHGRSVTFTAIVTPPAGASLSGIVTFKDGSTTLGTLTVSTSTHKAMLATSALSAGTHSITAVYNGNSNLNGSTSAVLRQTVR